MNNHRKRTGKLLHVPATMLALLFSQLVAAGGFDQVL